MRLAWLGAIAVLAASDVSAQSVGLFGDAAGTACNVVAPLDVPVTAYIVLGPGPEPLGIEFVTVRIVVEGGNGGLFVGLEPGPSVSFVIGNPFSSGGAVVYVNELCSLTGPVVLFTVTLTRRFGSGNARTVETFGDWRRCASTQMIATLTRSTLNGVPSTPTPPSAVFPPDQATDVTPSSGGNYLYWLPYTDIYACPRVTSRLYFGTDTNPPLVAPALPGTSFHVGVLEPATTYYWRVEFHLAPSGTILAGPLWQFTTSGICPQTCETSPPACPVVCLFTTDNTLADICSEAISGEFTRSYSCLNTGVGGTASFDRTTGYVAALAGTRGECPAVLSDVVSADRFWLVGPESSEPIAFTARIDFEGQNFPDGALREGAGDVEWVGGGQHSIALQHVPGNAFILRYGVKATADGGRDPAPGSVFGQLTFPGLPDGYTIASCAGYATPVPIQPASWSSMKELFR